MGQIRDCYWVYSNWIVGYAHRPGLFSRSYHSASSTGDSANSVTNRAVITSQYSGTLPVPVATTSVKWVYCPSLVGTAVLNSPRERMSVSCLYCVLSGRDLCDGLITRPEDFQRVWMSECDRGTSTMRRHWLTRAVEPLNISTRGFHVNNKRICIAWFVTVKPLLLSTCVFWHLPTSASVNLPCNTLTFSHHASYM